MKYDREKKDNQRKKIIGRKRKTVKAKEYLRKKRSSGEKLEWKKVKIDQKEVGRKSIQQYRFRMMTIYRGIDMKIYCLGGL